MKTTILLSVIFISLIFISTVHAEREFCSGRLIDSTIDGYRMPNAKGNFEGTFKMNKETGSMSINTEGISELNEKIVLDSDIKINSVTRRDGNDILEGYATSLTVSEGNAKIGLRNVPISINWNKEDKRVYIAFTHQYLEETAITFKENNC